MATIMMKGDTITNIKMEIRENYKHFCAYTFNNLDIMDKFFKNHKLPKVT